MGRGAEDQEIRLGVRPPPARAGAHAEGPAAAGRPGGEEGRSPDRSLAGASRERRHGPLCPPRGDTRRRRPLGPAARRAGGGAPVRRAHLPCP